MRFKKLDSRAKSPSRNNDSDAGYDLYALEDCTIQPIMSDPSRGMLGAAKIKTGIALEIPNGEYGLILDRSSMGSKLIKSLGGVIDSGYRGDVTVCLANLSYYPYEIKAGDKVAQIVFHKYQNHVMEESDNLDSSERDAKGFGSSGR